MIGLIIFLIVTTLKLLADGQTVSHSFAPLEDVTYYYYFLSLIQSRHKYYLN